MRTSWSVIAMAAGGLLLGVAHSALADHQRYSNDRYDQSYRSDRSAGSDRGAWSDRGNQYDRSDWRASRNEGRAARNDRERRWWVEGRDRRGDQWGSDGGRVSDRRGSRHSGSPFTYIEATDARRGSTNGDHSRGWEGHR